MVSSSRRQALFAGLIFSEQDEPAEVTYVGDEPHYVIPDAGFRRHVASEHIDRQVLEWLQEQFLANKELITEGILAMLGKEDLFTKAMIDASMQNMDQLIEHGTTITKEVFKSLWQKAVESFGWDTEDVPIPRVDRKKQLQDEANKRKKK